VDIYIFVSKAVYRFLHLIKVYRFHLIPRFLDLILMYILLPAILS
jgi:hypothetical protein